VMIAICECAQEIDQLRKNFGWDMLTPFEPGADSVECAQCPLNNPMFVFERV
jgi:hypothetical protein